jgi:peroxiredoxin
VIPAVLNVGDAAPGFTAAASDGRRYALDELLARGAVALFFYPGNDTPG